jgi:hypothetical protein
MKTKKPRKMSYKISGSGKETERIGLRKKWKEILE